MTDAQAVVRRLSDGGSRKTSRQGFLAKAGLASLAALAGVVAVKPGSAHAYGGEHGCGLCDPLSGPCGNITCWWCWWGDPHRNGPGCTNCHQTQCCEGYTTAGSGCAGGGCTGSQSCSRYGASRDAPGCGPC
jgi:hypothetical protein